MQLFIEAFTPSLVVFYLSLRHWRVLTKMLSYFSEKLGYNLSYICNLNSNYINFLGHQDAEDSFQKLNIEYDALSKLDGHSKSLTFAKLIFYASSLSVTTVLLFWLLKRVFSLIILDYQISFYIIISSFCVFIFICLTFHSFSFIHKHRF